jgi:hypothetical protein
MHAAHSFEEVAISITACGWRREVRRRFPSLAGGFVSLADDAPPDDDAELNGSFGESDYDLGGDAGGEDQRAIHVPISTYSGTFGRKGKDGDYRRTGQRTPEFRRAGDENRTRVISLED